MRLTATDLKRFMRSFSRFIVIYGASGSGKTSFAFSLLKYYKEFGISALLIDDPDIEDLEIQRISETNLFSYILLTMSPDKKLNAQCLEQPFQTIILTEKGH